MFVWSNKQFVTESRHCTYSRVPVHFDYRCGLGVTLLLLTQRARVQSPVGSISWLRFIPGFSLNGKTSVTKFRQHSSPVIIWTSYIIQTIYHPSTDGDGLCSTWLFASTLLPGTVQRIRTSPMAIAGLNKVADNYASKPIDVIRIDKIKFLK